MTKLISGRVKKIPSANVGASRYDFIKLSETEPDLGLPAANGYVLSGNVDGTRRWILPPDAAIATSAQTANVANTVLSISNFTTANLAEGVNLYYTNARVYSNVIGLINVKANVSDLTTANVVELTNLYYTNARVYSNVIGLLNAKANVSDLTTANVAESLNSLYYTNARVDSYVTPKLTTANVVESASNLYYTNARVQNYLERVDGNILPISSGPYDIGSETHAWRDLWLQGTSVKFVNSGAISAQANTFTITDARGNVVFTANATNIPITSPDGKLSASLLSGVANYSTSNVAEGSNLYYTNARVDSYITTKLTTANVVESASNLYYTESRANLAIDNRVTKTFVENLGISVSTASFAQTSNVANTVLSLTNFTTANLAEGTNLYYTNARVYSNVIGLIDVKANVSDLTTANVIESAGNLYFTVARANTAIDNRVTKSFIDNLGISVSTATFAETANVSNTVLSISNFSTSNLSEGTNLYYNNTRVQAYVSPLLNAKANVSDLTTANVAELTNLYYTNARVYSNITALLPVYTGNINAGNVIANAIIGSGGGGSITGANLISTNVISATTWVGLYASNVIGLTTANVTELTNLYYTNARVYSNVIGLIGGKANVSDLTTANVAELTNLYYTNARVYSNISPLLGAKANVSDLTTANVAEVGNNIFYTNARVYSNVITLLPTYTGNVNAGNIIANTIIGQGGGSITGANLISTNVISATTWVGLYAANIVGLTTANVTELTNLYYTNARVYSNVIGLIGGKANVSDLTTANVTELTNLYYTNARVYSNISPLLVAKANVSDLTTANVAEVGNNIFYTNARVYSNVAAMLPTYTGNINAGNVIANTIIGTSGGFITGANLISTNIIVASTWTGLYASNVIGLTTANVTELTNLYYTNARVYSNVIGLIGGKANVSDLTSANVTELTNLYYTNARVYSNVIGLIGNKANVSDLTTANVAEVGNNIFYTNARVYSNVIALLPVYTGNVNAGNIIANTIIGQGGGFITGANLISTNVISATTWIGLYAANVAGLTTANVTELNNLYYTNARVYSNVIGLIGGKANVSDLTTANVTELNNLYYTNARVYSNVIGLIGNKANVGDLTTANVAELTNLYYTNARVYSNISPLLGAKANVSDLTTANVAEFGNNIFYTNARVYANVIAILPTYTGNLSAGNVLANAIISTGGSSGTISATNDFSISAGSNINLVAPNTFANNLTVNRITSNIWTGLYAANIIGLTTANVTELNNLYYTNARVYSNISPLLFNYQTLANAALKANVSDLTTANVAELTNLYYTNARVYSNVIGLIGNKANVSDLTTANVTELNNLYYTNARVYSNVIGLLNAKANVADLNTSNIIEGNNLYFTNARVLAGLVTSNLVVNDATIRGNLYVEGDIVTLNAATLSIEDKNIVLANGAINSTAADGAGFNIDGAQANLKYRNTGDKFEFNKSLDVLGTITANVWGGLYAANVIGLTTANVVESASNLYYTVARANAAIDNRVTKAFVDALGVSTNTAVFAETSNVANTVLSIGNFTTTNLAEGTNLYYTNARVNSQVESNLALKANVSDLTTANVAELTNLYYTNNRVYSNVVAVLPNYTGNVAAGNVTIGSGTGGSLIGANLISATYISATNWTGIYTANVIESASNLYYTITRANTAIDARVNKAFVDALGITTNTAVFAQTANVANTVLSIGNFTTANLIENTNLYYTNARVYSNVIGLINVKANVSDLTTANVAELTNLYYTNARVYSNVITLLPTYTGNVNAGNIIANTIIGTGGGGGGGFITGANLISTNIISATTWLGLYAANVVGLTTANVTELTNLYYTNARV